LDRARAQKKLLQGFQDDTESGDKIHALVLAATGDKKAAENERMNHVQFIMSRKSGSQRREDLFKRDIASHAGSMLSPETEAMMNGIKQAAAGMMSGGGSGITDNSTF
jgi:hypothetical protein